MEYLFFIILIFAIFFDKNTIENKKKSINNDKIKYDDKIEKNKSIQNENSNKNFLEDTDQIEKEKLEIKLDQELDEELEEESEMDSKIQNDKLGLSEENNFLNFLSGSNNIRENFMSDKDFKINYNNIKDYNDKSLEERDIYDDKIPIKDVNDIEYNYENVKQLDYEYKPKKKEFNYKSMEDKNNRLINEDNNITEKSNFVLEKLSGEDLGFSNIDKIDTKYSFFQKDIENIDINYGNDYNNKKKNIYSLNFNYNKINNKSKTFGEKHRKTFFNEKKDKYNILNNISNNDINIYNLNYKNKNGIHEIKLNKNLKIAKPFERPQLNTKYNPILPNKTNLDSNQSIAFKGLDNFRNLKRENLNKIGTIEEVSNNFNSLLVNNVNLETIQENTLVSSKTIFKTN